MAESDDMTEDEQAPTTEPIAPQGPSKAVVVASDPFAGYMAANAAIIEGEWGGMPAFRCSACPFDSLERDKTQAHLAIHGMTYTQGD